MKCTTSYQSEAQLRRGYACERIIVTKHLELMPKLASKVNWEETTTILRFSQHYAALSMCSNLTIAAIHISQQERLVGITRQSF